MDRIEQRICEIIDRRQEELSAFGRDIFCHAELGYKEVRTSEKFAAQMRALGLETETGLALTGVKSWLRPQGGEGPNLAVIGELDALPIPGQPDAWKETGASHCCGHNAQLTGVVGAAMALSDPEVRAALGGNLCFLAAPAEEYVEIGYRTRLLDEGRIRYGGGKCEMIRIGAFDDIDLALAHHTQPGLEIGITNGTSNGFVNKTIEYLGRSAHAAAAPETGIDALNAAALALHAIDLQRESFREKDTVRVHGFLSEGGRASNVIADRTAMEYTIRAASIPGFIDASRKVDRAFRAGAVATGCGLVIRTMPGYLPQVTNPDITPLAEAADVMAGTGYRIDRVPDGSHMAASTDLGDVSCLMPVTVFNTGGYSGHLHSPDIRVTDEVLAYGVTAKLFALTAYRMMRNGAAFARKSAAEYKPLLTKEKYVELQESMLTTETIARNPLPAVE